MKANVEPLGGGEGYSCLSAEGDTRVDNYAYRLNNHTREGQVKSRCVTYVTFSEDDQCMQGPSRALSPSPLTHALLPTPFSSRDMTGGGGESPKVRT